ncbi:MAG TPA: kelch repeat-containing protein, partial [Geothrix sp.]|nr:kelch repeat-containing protein [Geothrix sp.]
NGMASVRDYPSAVLLPSGKVLVLGGYNPALPLPRQLDSADLYDPATHLFTPSASHMGTKRQQFTATLLLNGKVLITGGFLDTGATALGSAELYDPVTDTFQPSAGTLGYPRWGHLAVLLPSGKVFIAGGNGGTAVGAELYDPQLDAFLPTGGTNLVASWNTATLLPNGQVLLALAGSSTAGISMLYDPSTGLATPSTGTPDPTRVQAPTATLLGDGRVLLAGNLGAPGADVAGDCEIFNPATGLYNYTANPGDRWEHNASQLADGRVLLVGGWNSSLTTALNTGTLFNAGPAVAAPAASATISAASSAAAGTAGHLASVPATVGAAYFWTIANGTITAGRGTASITFTAGTAGSLQLECLVVSAAGIPAQGSATLTVTP